MEIADNGCCCFRDTVSCGPPDPGDVDEVMDLLPLVSDVTSVGINIGGGGGGGGLGELEVCGDIAVAGTNGVASVGETGGGGAAGATDGCGYAWDELELLLAVTTDGVWV